VPRFFTPFEWLQILACWDNTPDNTDVRLQRNIASEGGKASGGSFEKGSEKAKEAGKKGGSKTASD
jgi:general stress protein YciG